MDKISYLAQEQESGSEEGAIFYLAFFCTYIETNSVFVLF